MVCLEHGEAAGQPAERLVDGLPDFGGQRLNILQIGLGTFGTFLQNLTKPQEVYPVVSWLLEAASNSSTNLLGVGVEPVPEHVERLQPLLRWLPNAALVRAAVGSMDQDVEVHAITPERYRKYVQTVRPTELQAFDDLVLFLRNMSCVGQAHPEFKRFSVELEVQCGVKVETDTIKAKAVTYDALSRMLHFSGVEVLLIDAEGCDCKILQSMIEHCKQQGRERAWPDVIQFETMGHSNRVGCGYDAEDEMCRALEASGYFVACYGSDTQVVREAAFAREPRVQRWVETFHCAHCHIVGHPGMPYIFCPGVGAARGGGTLCRACGGLFHRFGSAIWEWKAAASDPKLCSVTTSGTTLWGLCQDGSACCSRDGHWQYFGGRLRSLTVPRDESQLWGLDDSGQLLQRPARAGRWRELHGSPRLTCISASGDGTMLWCVDYHGRMSVYHTAARWWQNLDGVLEQVSVSWDARHVWGLNWQGRVYYRHGIFGTWTQVQGRLRQIAVSGDGRHVWGVNESRQIFYRAGFYSDWLKVPGSLTQVCCAEDGSGAWGTDRHGYVWSFHV